MVRKVSLRVTVIATAKRVCHRVAVERVIEKKTKLPDIVRHRQEDAADSDSIDSSSSSKTDSEKRGPTKVHHSKHILKLPKFESFWA